MVVLEEKTYQVEYKRESVRIHMCLLITHTQPHLKNRAWYSTCVNLLNCKTLDSQGDDKNDDQ